MTPAQLRLAAADWRQTYEAIHGPLDPQTAETVNEALGFLITCAQVTVSAEVPEQVEQEAAR